MWQLWFLQGITFASMQPTYCSVCMLYIHAHYVQQTIRSSWAGSTADACGFVSNSFYEELMVWWSVLVVTVLDFTVPQKNTAGVITFYLIMLILLCSYCVESSGLLLHFQFHKWCSTALTSTDDCEPSIALLQRNARAAFCTTVIKKGNLECWVFKNNKKGTKLYFKGKTNNQHSLLDTSMAFYWFCGRKSQLTPSEQSTKLIAGKGLGNG